MPVEEADAAAEVADWKPAPLVLGAVVVAPLLPVVVAAELDSVAELMVVFRNMAVPVAMPEPPVDDMTGTVVEAVPFAETVLLLVALLPPLSDSEADGLAPWI